MTPQALQYAEEFAGVFYPAMPPHGWEALIAELDEFTDTTLAKVDSLLMPKPIYETSELLSGKDTRGGCAFWYDYADGDGRECHRTASITDLESGQSFCMKCWLATQ